MSTRLTADERRAEVVAAAAAEFANGGYAGTSAEVIARRAGVSQPYLFQLFGTKKELFLAVVRDCFALTQRTFEEAGKAARARGLDPAATLNEMGQAYLPLLVSDRQILRLQLHSYAAATQDPEIRDAVRTAWFGLWHAVAGVSGATDIELRNWFATGMLINVLASFDDLRSVEEFHAALVGGTSMSNCD